MLFLRDYIRNRSKLIRCLWMRLMEIWGGIECTVNRVGDRYFDQVAYQGHFERPEDLKQICDLGIKKLRYPVLWEKHGARAGKRPDWGPLPQNLAYLRNRGVEVIAGLVHHGCGPENVSFLDDSFARGLAGYAAEVAAAFPWINLYTPVNEPLTTARFSGLYGFWYPHLKDTAGFLTILVSECRATILAMQAIRKINPAAKLVFTEDLAEIHSTPALADQAAFENQRRWLSIDLICGKVTPEHPLYACLITAGIPPADLQFFTAHALVPDILGFNYYLTSERYLDTALSLYPAHTHGGNGKVAYADVEAIRTGSAVLSGPVKLLKAAWERYHIPMAITEAHLHCGREDQLRWLQYIWDSAKSLAAEQIPIVAVTSWALTGAYGWDKLLTEGKGSYESGAFCLRSGALRPTALSLQIRCLAAEKHFCHPLAAAPGWWEKPERILYGKPEGLSASGRQQTGPPVLWIDSTEDTGQAFRQACDQRDIRCVRIPVSGTGSATDRMKLCIELWQPWLVAGGSTPDHATGETVRNLAGICYRQGIKQLSLSAAHAGAILAVNPDALVMYPAAGSKNEVNPDHCLDLLIDDCKGRYELLHQPVEYSITDQ